MPSYSEERKAAVLKKLLTPQNRNQGRVGFYEVRKKIPKRTVLT
jgi:hypothetical protein